MQVPRLLVPHIRCAQYGFVVDKLGRQLKQKWTVSDASVLPLALEQMLGLGVASFYLSSNYYEQALASLHPFIRRRVKTLKNPSVYQERALFILDPILREFGLHDLDDDGVAYASIDTKADDREAAAVALIGLIKPLRHFLIATENRLHLTLDIQKLRDDLQILTSIASRSDSRAHLAELIAIFSCYESLPREGFVLNATLNDDQVTFFKLFVRDAQFSKLQQAGMNLGYARKTRSAVIDSGHILRRLIAANPFREVVEWSSKLISVATGIPIPGASFAKALVRDAYLPPIVTADAQIAATQSAWIRIKPAYIPTGTNTWCIKPEDYIIGFGDEFGLSGISWKSSRERR